MAVFRPATTRFTPHRAPRPCPQFKSTLLCCAGTQDYTDPAKARHLLRLWVAVPNGPELPDDPQGYYKVSWGSVQVGSRGG